jgi:hypothetical protein
VDEAVRKAKKYLKQTKPYILLKKAKFQARIEKVSERRISQHRYFVELLESKKMLKR